MGFLPFMPIRLPVCQQMSRLVIVCVYYGAMQAQRGFNAALHHQQLCLNETTASATINCTDNSANSNSLYGSQSTLQYGHLAGTTRKGNSLSVATLSVCAPCEKCSTAAGSTLLHANCLGTKAEAKMAWLNKTACWKLPENWRSLNRTGDAAGFLLGLLGLSANRSTRL